MPLWQGDPYLLTHTHEFVRSVAPSNMLLDSSFDFSRANEELLQCFLQASVVVSHHVNRTLLHPQHCNGICDLWARVSGFVTVSRWT